MPGHASRFSYEAPGLLRFAWYAIFRDWEERVRAWVTDHKRGERFQLSEDEELMMAVLADNMDAAADLANVSFWKLNRFWTPEKIDLVRDRVLAAISNQRHGDPKEWDRFKAMTPEEWIDWVRAIAEN